MQLLSVLPDVLPLVVGLADEVPEEEDVKAGWTAFVIFIAGIVAVALLGFSLVRQLRKAQAAEEAGLYDPSDRALREKRAREAMEAREAGEAQASRDAEEPPTA